MFEESLYSILPDVGREAPEMIFKSVDFPVPLEPVIAKWLPDRISNVRSLNIVFRLKALLSFCIDRSIDRIVCSEAPHDATLRLIDKVKYQFLFRAIRNSILDDRHSLADIETPDKK